MDKEKARLTSNNLLLSNSLIVIIAKVFPMIVGIITIPLLITVLGNENFGTLALIWLILNYFSMFDLGIGRALIKELSVCIDLEDDRLFAETAWTGIIFITIMGFIASSLLYFFGEFLLNNVFENDSDLAGKSLLYVSLAVPFTVSMTSFKSVLTATQKFKHISLIQSVNSLFNYTLPLIVIYFFGKNFILVVFSLILLKISTFIAYSATTLLTELSLIKWFHFNRIQFRKMIDFGKWVIVSNIISPIIGQLDRYFIAAIISVTAVTFYTTPIEVVSKVMIIPMAIISVLFPAFSALSNETSSRREEILIQGSKAVMILLFPVMLLLSGFADVLLEFWLGSEFLDKSYFITKVVCLIYFIKGCSYLNATYLHGINLPFLTAKFHLLELIIALPLIYYTSKRGNIDVVVLSVLVISLIDTLLLLGSVFKNLEAKQQFLNHVVKPLTLSVIILIILIISDFQILNWIITITVFAAYLVMERNYLLKSFRKLRTGLS